MANNLIFPNISLPTIGVGSYATPGWLFPFRKAMQEGKVGEADITEAFEDATRIAIADQVEAGMNIISDGELQRQRFVFEMYDRITGITRQKVERRLGVSGYDMAPSFVADERLQAPGGLGLVTEYETFKRLAPNGPVLKMALPGPLTFATNIVPGKAYGSGPGAQDELMADVIAMLRAELGALVAAGVEVIQLDEPGLPHPPEGMSVVDGAAAINKTLEGIDVKTAVHICFGNNASRPFARRDFGRLLPGMDQLKTDILMLEFANREMADVETLADLGQDYHIAAGVIDVKNFHVETPDEVADRLRRILSFMPAEKLMVTTDCGFSAIPRWLAREKMVAMVQGTEIVRNELT
jgi:5-methyltetrahydropteroyltriglutamate--homocysteine methyltransferase